MKRILGSLQRRSSSSLNGSPAYPDDSPEGRIINEVNAFCESGRDPAQGNEFIHLPAIVENAESSPMAAREAAVRIRKLLSDPAGTPAYVQYNAFMLVPILVDNPGHSFTRNLDPKFVSTVKDLLRHARDLGVQHFMRQTLNALEAQRSWDQDLKPLLQMWEKEKNKLGRVNSSNFPQPSLPGRTLPPPDELAARISEAKSSAKLLIQFVESTPVTEVLDNELMKEFCDRCRSASRSVQSYIHSTNPAPDEDTLTTLIEVNDELSVALSRHQHALLKARKALGRNGTPSPVSSSAAASASGAVRPPPPPVPRRDTQSPPAVGAPAPATTASEGIPSSGTGRYEYRSEDYQVRNPFADDYATETRAEERNTQRSERAV
ncbi:hypothetical protein PHISP_04804 [Aspergillus sp. HF37]|nr:hypothetical protein PHISP_04804 [Aspergillus sp. HF37]